MPRLSRSYQAVYRSYVDSVRVNDVDELSEVLYMRLLTCSDDYGRFWGSAFQVCHKALGLRAEKGQVDTEETERRLLALEAGSLIVRYKVNGQHLLELVDYDDPTEEKRRKAVYPGSDEADDEPGAGPPQAHTPLGDTVSPTSTRRVPLAPAATPTPAAAADAREAEPPPKAQHPAEASAAAADPPDQPEGQAATDPPASSKSPPKAKLGAGLSVFSVFVGHLDAVKAKGCTARLQGLCEAHGIEPVRRWAEWRLKAWKAKSNAGTGLLVKMILEDPFSDPEPPPVAKTYARKEPEPDPAPAPYPLGLFGRLAIEDREAHQALKLQEPESIAAELRKRYPDDPAWEKFKEPAA